MSKPGSQWWQLLDIDFTVLGEGVDSLEPRVWLSPTVLHSCTPVWGSQAPVTCREILPVQSCLCRPVSEYCSTPLTGWCAARELTSTASCWASSCLHLWSPGPVSVLLVESLCAVGASTSSTIALPAGMSAKLTMEEGCSV